MLDALSAETLKLKRHKATWGLVWIYPIVLIAVGLIMVAVALTGADDSKPQSQSLQSWLDGADDFWEAPRQAMVRILLAGYIAVVFAGEYSWNTWKLIVPHRRRATLIGAKYVVATLFLLAGLTMGALVFNLVLWTEDVISGDTIPAGITLGALASGHSTGLLTIVAPLLVTVGYASLAAILTRSMVGALIVSVVLIAVESLIASFAPLLATYLPGAMWALYHLLPGFHIANIASWIAEGAGAQTPFPSGAVASASLATSLAVAGAWIVGLFALTFAWFARQDIN